MKLKLFVLISVFALALPFFGCAGPKAASEPLEAPGDLSYEELKTDERFRKYNSVGIQPLKTEGVMFLSTDSDEQREMEDFAKAANEFLMKGFLDEMKDNYYKKYGRVDREGDEKNYDLVITGRFVEMDRGNAAGRFWGVGGQTRVLVEGSMTETATGKEVVRFRDVKMGTGNLGSMLLLQNNCKDIGSNISDFLEEVY